MNITTVMKFACNKHNGQKYGDHIYDIHLLGVVWTLGLLFNKREDDWAAVAWCHDVAEDTNTTINELYDLGLDNDQVEAIILLTKAKDETRGNYLRRIVDSDNPYAWKVKVADAYSNLTESIKINDNRRVHRYLDTLKILYSKGE